MAKFLKNTIWTLMAVLAVLVALMSWRFFFGTQFIDEGPLAYHLNTNPMSAFFHFTFAPLALLIGSLQFSTKIRLKHKKIHSVIGFIYIFSCIAGGLSSIPLALITDAMPTASVGFFLLAIFWLSATCLGSYFIFQGSYKKHEAWMIRSYALTYASVTLRLYMSLTATITGDVSPFTYSIIAWACWLPNLIIAEGLVRLKAHQPLRLPSQSM